MTRANDEAGAVPAVIPFVGRSAELESVRAYLAQARSGGPRLVLITGDAGMGKTRLLRELRATMDAPAMVLYGHCYEDVSSPYLPFVEVIRSCLEQRPEALSLLAAAEAATIARLLGKGGERAEEEPALVGAEGDQIRLFLAASRLLIESARGGPVVLVLDDLHWADEPSAGMLTHLVFALAERAARQTVPFLVIATYRSVEADARVARAIDRLRREEICETIELAGLDDMETAHLVSALGYARPSRQLLTTLLEATGGNPLFIQEAMHHLAKGGKITESGGYLTATARAADLRLPSQVTDAIALRVQALGDRQRRTLTLAAFLGERFDFATLMAVGDCSEQELMDTLEEAIRQRFLSGDGSEFRFTHHLVRHVLYAATSAPRRQRLHHQIAEALERLYADSIDEHIVQIAHHLVQSGPVAEAEKVVEYGRRAGDHAGGIFAWGEAARYYEAALGAAGTGDYISLQDMAELHYRAGWSYYRDTDLGPAREHFDQAINGFDATGDVRGTALAAGGKVRILYNTTSPGTLVELGTLEQVLEKLEDKDARLRSHLLCIMSEAYWTARRPQEAIKLAEQARKLGDELEDDGGWRDRWSQAPPTASLSKNSVCFQADAAAALARFGSVDLEGALAHWERALAAAKEMDDPVLVAWPLLRKPLPLIWSGRLDEARAAALEGEALTRRIGDWTSYSLAMLALGSISLIRGDFAAVESYAARGVTAARRSRYPTGAAGILPGLACARFLRGDLEEAEDAIQVLATPGSIYDEPGPAIAALAWVYRLLLQAAGGETEGVRRIFQAGIATAAGAAGRDLASIPGRAALVETADYLDDKDIAGSQYEPLLQAFERGAVFTTSWLFSTPRVLGLIAAVNRWWDKAEAHYSEARRAAAAAGSRPELGRTCLDHARMLVARGQRADRARVTELITEAGVIFAELGMEPFSRRAASLAQELETGVALPAGKAARHPDGLSDREVEVLMLIARGRTNKAIADELVLSPKTVARHVSNIFDKTGVDNRAAATAYAFEKGLASTAQAPSRGEAAPAITPARGPPPAELQQGAPAAPGLRAPVTILFTDIGGSVPLTQDLGDAGAQELLRAHNAIIRDCLRAQGGSEIKHTGDGVMASFPSASAAVRCAAAIQVAFAERNRRHPDTLLRVRIGLNAGEPVAEEGDLFGTAVQVAGRICGRAEPGQILVSEVVRQLVAGKGFDFADRGRVALKGFSERFRLYEVRWQRE